MFQSVVLLALLLTQSCANFLVKKNNYVDENSIYSIVDKEISNAHATNLKECNCMKAFYRDLMTSPDNSSRYVFDRIVGEEAVKLRSKQNSVSILAIGSGKLLNELTAFAQVLARGINLHIYLTDWAYIFYGEPDFEKKALDLGKHPDKIPEAWKNFYFWAWYKNKEKPYLPFFIEHHKALDEFKLVMAKLDKIFHTNSTIEIIKPPINETVILPELDMITSIDSFIDVPNLIWNLFYQFSLTKNPVRFIALNKTKPRPIGGFWESPDLSKREFNSMQKVNLDTYNITSKGPDFGSYKMLNSRSFEPTPEQLKRAPEFKTDPDKDSTQNIFEEHYSIVAPNPSQPN